VDKGKGVVRWITTEELDLTEHYDGGLKQRNGPTDCDVGLGRWICGGWR
jgi:hypothetical protein